MLAHENGLREGLPTDPNSHGMTKLGFPANLAAWSCESRSSRRICAMNFSGLSTRGASGEAWSSLSRTDKSTPSNVMSEAGGFALA